MNELELLAAILGAVQGLQLTLDGFRPFLEQVQFFAGFVAVMSFGLLVRSVLRRG